MTFVYFFLYKYQPPPPFDVRYSGTLKLKTSCIATILPYTASKRIRTLTFNTYGLDILSPPPRLFLFWCSEALGELGVLPSRVNHRVFSGPQNLPWIYGSKTWEQVVNIFVQTALCQSNHRGRFHNLLMISPRELRSV